MNRKILLFAFLMLISFGMYAQKIQEYIGTPDRCEVALDTKGLPDGGAVIVGYTTELDMSNNYDYRNTDMLIMRVDNAGNVMWNKRLGVSGLEDMFRKVIVDDNGDFVAVGFSNHVPWNITSTIASSATIYSFDANTGIINWSNFVTSATTNTNDKGSIYDDVVQLDNGDYVAVGARDAQPGWSDGMVTSFGAGGIVNWNRVFNIGNTDALYGVTTDANRIFVGGIHIGGTYYDLNIAEMTSAGATVWTNSYPYSVFHPGISQNLTCNWVEEMHVEGGELMVLTTASNDYSASAGSMAGILRLDMSGTVLSLWEFNETSQAFCNLPSVDFESISNAYYVLNPSNTGMNIHNPPAGPLALADAFLANVDPIAGVSSNGRRLVHTGTQSIMSVNLLGTGSYYAGAAENDPAQIGPVDIFYVRSENGLPDHYQDCPITDEVLDDASVSLSASTLNYPLIVTYSNPRPQMDEYDEPLVVSILCYEEPCNVEDITFCGSLANPYTYTFNVDGTPPGANVIWDFGDGSPTVNSTIGTPVMHTYAGAGTYTVCVTIINPSTGDPCDEQCIELCIADNGSAKPAKTIKRANVVPVHEENTLIGELYPNPTDGTLNIPVTTKLTSDKVSIRILRMDGVVVYDSKTTIENGKQVLKVEMSDLVPGNYMCEIRSGQTKNVKVFTKN